jgi:hypothetical protein
LLRSLRTIEHHLCSNARLYDPPLKRYQQIKVQPFCGARDVRGRPVKGKLIRQRGRPHPFNLPRSQRLRLDPSKLVIEPSGRVRPRLRCPPTRDFNPSKADFSVIANDETIGSARSIAIMNLRSTGLVTSVRKPNIIAPDEDWSQISRRTTFEPTSRLEPRCTILRTTISVNEDG